MEVEILNRWRAGTVRLGDETEARGRVLEARESVEVPLGKIKAFYGVSE